MTGVLAGRVAVVTGGSRGIGRACVLALAREGADVVVNYVASTEAAERCAEEARALGVRALAVRADVGYVEEATRLIATAEAELGRVDVLVNNAAVGRGRKVQYTTDEEWEETIRTNLSSTFFCMRAVIPGMRERQYGRIVNIASMAGQTSMIGLGPYGASKAGVISLTQAAALELAKDGITVNAVCPGYVETDMSQQMSRGHRERMMLDIPMQRMATAEEIALSVVFLCGPGGAYYTGAQLSPNGGHRL